MLTTEERKQRAKRHAEERRERDRRFPHAWLDRIDEDSGVVLEMKAGDDSWLTVLARGEWRESARHSKSWRVHDILLDDPVALARFISALSARYNAMVLEMNKHANSARMEGAILISDEIRARGKA